MPMFLKKKFLTKTPKACGCFLLLLLLAACQQSTEEETTDSAAIEAMANISVVDFAGNTVTLPRAAERIIALAPHIVENLYSIGAGEKLVGVVDHSDYPAAASKLPIVGGYGKINYEQILALNPDLIIAWKSGHTAVNLQRLRELGFTLFIDEPKSLDELSNSLIKLGKLVGTQAQASQVTKDFQKKLDELRNENQNKATLSTFYQVWDKPLMTINGQHIISDALKTCGGENIFASESITAPKINKEAVIDRNPQIIITSAMVSDMPDLLKNWKQWDTISAVKFNNLFHVNPDHLQRHTLRQLLAIDSICEKMDLARTRLGLNQ